MGKGEMLCDLNIKAGRDIQVSECGGKPPSYRAQEVETSVLNPLYTYTHNSSVFFHSFLNQEKI